MIVAIVYASGKITHTGTVSNLSNDALPSVITGSVGDATMNNKIIISI